MRANDHLHHVPLLVASFSVPGIPVAKGGLRAITLPGQKFTTLVWKAKGLAKWVRAVKNAAALSMYGRAPVTDCPVRLTLTFCLAPPKKLTRYAPWSRPDLDKLERAILDSLTGIVYQDDGQVVSMRTDKLWVERGVPGVSITADYWPGPSGPTGHAR
jgi:crossover junction endodeoxyribonuclease RusA